MRKTCGVGRCYRDYRSLLEETRWLGCWLLFVCLETRWPGQSPQFLSPRDAAVAAALAGVSKNLKEGGHALCLKGSTTRVKVTTNIRRANTTTTTTTVVCIREAPRGLKSGSRNEPDRSETMWV